MTVGVSKSKSMAIVKVKVLVRIGLSSVCLTGLDFENGVLCSGDLPQALSAGIWNVRSYESVS